MVYTRYGLVLIPVLLIILVNTFLAIIAYHYYMRMQQTIEFNRIQYYVENTITLIHTAITVKYLSKVNDTLVIPLKIPNGIMVIICGNEVKYYPKVKVDLPDIANIISSLECGLVKYKFNITQSTIILSKGDYILSVSGYPPVIHINSK
ncbi:MAG TPA: hypothetical protein EYH40_04790 [Desulfurococcales archaeon]|nr:hypothetical protein [Desulfurococcales archaeon]